MKKFIPLLFVISLFNLKETVAQEFPSEMWHDGKLVLLEGDTLRGKLKYDFEMDLVQLLSNNVLQTYSARKILYFEIYDNNIGSYRYFYSLPYKIEATYMAPILFEVLYEGQLSLLCREVIVTETVSNYSYYSYRQPYYSTRSRLDFAYFFLDQQGEIERYAMKKAELLSIMKSKSSQVKQYMKKNNLKHDKRSDLFRIVAYYNALLDG